MPLLAQTPSRLPLLPCAALQISGTGLREYLTANIFEPAGMADTFYDLAALGDTLVYERAVWNGGYVSLTNLSVSAGGGLAAAAPPKGVLSKVGYSNGPYYPGLQSMLAGAGAVMSTTADLHRWYQVLFTQPELIGLNAGG